MTLTIEVPDDIAAEVSALPETDRRNISTAASLVFAAALRSASREATTADEETTRSIESYHDLVTQLRATLRRNHELTESETDLIAIIQEASSQYDSGERGLPLTGSIGEIRSRLAKR